MGNDRLGAAVCEHAAAFDDVGTVHQLKQLASIVIRDEHADVTVRQVTNKRCDFLDGMRIEACKRLVEESKAGLAGKRDRDLAAAPLATG